MPDRIMKKSVNIYIAVGIGGAIGAMLRYSIAELVSFQSENVFPWATFLVNIAGVFILSYLLFHPSIKNKFSRMTYTALTTGVIGAFTTFSTIAVEVVTIWQVNKPIAISYTLLTFFIGLIASFAAYQIVQHKGSDASP